MLVDYVADWSWGRSIYCAYNVLEEMQKAYPTRDVMGTAYADHDWAYYQNGRGQLRSFNWRSKKVFTPGVFPNFRRVWPKRKKK